MSNAHFRTFTTRGFDYQVFRLEDSNTIRVYYRMPDGDWEFGHKVFKTEDMSDDVAFGLVYLYLAGMLTHADYNARLTVS